MLEPFTACWQREARASGTIVIETYVRLMDLKQRHG